MASFASTYGLLAVRSGFRPLIVQTWSRDATVVPFTGWKRVYYYPVVRRVLETADVITTDGPAYAEAVRRHFPGTSSKVVSTLWGIRLTDYAAGPEGRGQGRRFLEIPGEAVVCTSGRGVRAWYRPEVTLPALLRALEAEPSLYTVVLTLGHERTEGVSRLLRELVAHPRARVFDRFLSASEMRQVWAASDLIVSIPRFDGVSEGVLEAMLSGAVPILSDIPTNRAVFPEETRALYVGGGNVEELAARIGELVRRLPSLQSSLVPANREWVRTSASVEATARQVAGIVHSLAPRRESAGSTNLPATFD
jgi:glycosyltransferase involved in cell wall biosynthesis